MALDLWARLSPNKSQMPTGRKQESSRGKLHRVQASVLWPRCKPTWSQLQLRPQTCPVSPAHGSLRVKLRLFPVKEPGAGNGVLELECGGCVQGKLGLELTRSRLSGERMDVVRAAAACRL